MDETRKTIGEISRNLLLKGDQKQGVVDTQREADKTYYQEIEKCVKNKPHCDWIDPWYIVVLHKKEKLLPNVVRRYFFGRQSLPIPEYDQTIWRYYPSSGDLRFIWCLPDKQTAHDMYTFPTSIVPEQRKLLDFVLDFKNNTLYSDTLKKYPE